MSKTKAKRTVVCGGCGDEGHNKRTCPKGSVPTVETTTVVVTPPVTTSEPPKAVEAPKEITPPVPPKPVSPRHREAPTGDRGTAATAAPYRCVKCNQVSILAIVRVRNYGESQRLGKDVWKGDLRCEQCLNRPDPCNLILVWGAKPGQTITDAEANK